jgi:glycosyltransferase involved in cell wall biosynthesis
LGESHKPWRILMVAPTPFFADRGCHVRILGEAQALIELGNEVKICTYPLGRDVPGIPTERTLPVPWYKKLSAGPSVHKLYIDLLLLFKVLAVTRRFRPHVIHAHLHEGIVIGKIASTLFRVPLVADLQGSLTSELLDHKFIPGTSWLVKSMRRIERMINLMPRHLVVSSTRTARTCSEDFTIPPARISSIMDGVDLGVFSPRPRNAELSAKLGFQPDDRIVAFIGVLTEYQGVDLLLEAIPAVVKKIPRAKFLIIGYPEEQYQKKAEALGVAPWTCFTGRIPYADAPDYLSLAEVAVSPKFSTTEANLKLFTYMAMGLPTVVFDNEVNREILDDLGIYASSVDAPALASTLVRALERRDDTQELGRRARTKATADYSWLTVGERLQTIYANARLAAVVGSIYVSPDLWPGLS